MMTTTTTTAGESMTGWRAPTRGAALAAGIGLGVGPVVLGAALAAAAPVVSAQEAGCTGPEVLLVHDLAGTAADWDLLGGDLREAGWCPVALEWGRPRPGDVPLPVGGLTGVETAAVELVRELGWTEPGSGESERSTAPGADPDAARGRVSVVAKGVGGLVVQRALQLSGAGTPPVDTLVTLGPVWNGTNLLGVADVEDLSRELGTFDAILAWERTWMDPLCEGCREAVRGSDTLASLHRDGIRTPGVAYTDIATVTDLLVDPPLGQSPAGTDLRVLPARTGGLPVWHADLGRDLDSRASALAALGPT